MRAARAERDPLKWHVKPIGRGPCAICGCPAKSLRARHRRTVGGEFVKIVTLSFGGDFDTLTYSARGVWV
jgi:hypothetical protein